VHSRRAVIRIADAPRGKITGDWIRGHFPYAEDSDLYVFSHELISGVVFMAALPLELVWEVISDCKRQGINPAAIKRIDIIERQIFQKYAGRTGLSWICVAMDEGVRILTLSDGSPSGAHFISLEPGFREDEIRRLNLPEEAVMLGSCDWLSAYLLEAGVVSHEAV
jgi:hypothetical protein